MKSALIYLACFLLGILLTASGVLPFSLNLDTITLWVLYALLVLVGVGIGSDTQTLDKILHLRWQVLLVPGAVAVGSILGSGLVALLIITLQFRDGMAVGAGFAYYSLSSVLIHQLHSETLGVTALLSNVFREALTIFLAPLWVSVFGPLGLIASAGATAMDTTLPVIQKHAGKEYTLIAVYSGVILSL
ncbi:MAG: lysine exporter LysO family protein, partial [Anaerolineaceae bacterium]|nr:lysine exporter LysO family protein [Anaerolineaceae bacterium]